MSISSLYSVVIPSQHHRHCTYVALSLEKINPRNNQEDHQLPLTSRRSSNSNSNNKKTTWKKLDSTELGITTSMISKPTRIVLNALKKKGYEVYLVGGCVRDLILNRIPKDFDVVTSAGLKEVRKTFNQCEIVGRRFPICHVHVDDTIVEVSSFDTHGSNIGGNRSICDLKRPSDCSELDYIRWRNCSERDFTVNGLMFDPYAQIVYDYIGGIKDIRREKMRTVIAANLSFVEDCARILRAIRIAARLEFQFTKEIAVSLTELSPSVQRLDKGRILMELNYMLAYGSGEASLRLLWRFGLLEILLPIQASYFISQGFRRRDKRTNMLLTLFANLDKLLAPDRPCHSSLWIGILAFHKALVDKPRDPSVVAAFCLAVHSGGSLFDAVEIARTISQPHDSGFEELSPVHDLGTNRQLIAQVIDLAASIKNTVIKMSDSDYVSQSMVQYPKAPSSDMVFISHALSDRVCLIFKCVRRGNEGGSVPRPGRKINYESLACGNLQEVRCLFARVVFDTIYPPNNDTDDRSN
ncbi:hypothetical protein ACFE04_025293 [Oxalis oulophora]